LKNIPKKVEKQSFVSAQDEERLENSKNHIKISVYLRLSAVNSYVFEC